jgi:hypothetical protein
VSDSDPFSSKRKEKTKQNKTEWCEMKRKRNERKSGRLLVSNGEATPHSTNTNKQSEVGKQTNSYYDQQTQTYNGQNGEGKRRGPRGKNF